ncbi:MAG: diguanylate cyclase [Halieaceae bacterium]|uniref:GGDEF domain-containing protein n=1 Tax=Haliea alexandrii TaxID=2448162 RepID=UPI000F0B8084|nr:diguanylate cyclase [Haliea alexandrii]MCR9184153.1 diguanylate cyclase [Halieaceae bacterium]
MQRTEALTRLTLRLARMAEGNSDTIDEALARIRRLIHDNADGRELAAASDQLAKVVMAVTGDSPDNGGTLPASHDLSGLSSIIKAMPLRTEDHQRMTDLVRRISGETSQGARQHALGELLASATEALKEVAARQSRSQGGVRGLFKRRASDSADYDHFLELFTNLVHRLVDHIDVINGSQVRSKALRDALPDITVVDQAQALMREVTREMDSIDSRIRQERLQTSDFLDTLRERLGGFEELVVDVTRGGERSVERSESLQTQVAADVDVLGTASRSGDLETMRKAFEETLQNISQHMAEHVEAERQQHRDAQEKVDALSEQLTRLETEAEVLRTEIRNKTDLAIKDQLTGVYNRNGFDERAAELFARWERNAAKLSIVFVDCNKFKHINDTYGHAAGDLVLVKVADILQSRARVTDVVCRFGGDEFVILLPDTGIDGAETYAVSAFNEVLDAGFNDNGKPLDVSISLGITAIKEGDTLEIALARADEAMYEAKGKEGVRVARKP